MIFLALAQNIALLIALSMVRALLPGWLVGWPGRRGAWARQALDGLIFGGVGLAAMMTPLRIDSGAIFDSRSVILGVAGVFGGPITAGLAAIVCGAYRLWIGGAGTLVGLAVIVESAALGVAWHYLSRRRPELMGNVPLLGFGFLVHLVMVGMMMLLPSGMRWDVIEKISMPVLLLYPPATMLICRLFQSQHESSSLAARLAESEAIYRRLFQNKSIVMLIIDPIDGAIVDANPAAEKFYGWSREQLTRMRVSQINTLPEEEIKNEMLKALAQKHNHLKVYHRRADGSVSPVEVYSGSIEIQGRHLLYTIVHNTMDKYKSQEELVALNRELEESKRLAEENLQISERSRLALLSILEDERIARKSLKAAQEQYHDLLQSMVDGFVMVAMDGKITDFNESYRAMLGYSREELLESTYQQLTPERWHRMEVDMVRNEIMARGYSGIYEKEYRRKDGKAFPVELRSYLVKSPAGEPEGMWAIVRDVSEMKRAERAIRESEANLQKAQTIGHLGSWVWDLEAGTLGWSDELYRIWGLAKDSPLTFEGIEMLIHPADRALNQDNLQKIQGGADALDYEFRIIRPDGQIRHLYQVIEVSKDSKGKPARLFGIMQDISDRKTAEDHIKASLDEKEILLREVHHRVKNNLQVIISLLNIQSGYVKDPDDRRMFQESQNRVRSMALAHEKLCRSDNLADIRLEPYIKSLVNDLLAAYGANGQMIEPRLDISVESLPIDTAIPCGLIINELITNSLKYGFPSYHLLGRQAFIGIDIHRESDGRLALSVRDNGIGLGPNFNIKQAQGLGLQLVDILAGQLGGELEISGHEGASFRITV